MFKKALTESGRRILKAIKKLSTKSRVVTKSQQKQPRLINPQLNINNYNGNHSNKGRSNSDGNNQVPCELVTTAVPGWTVTYIEPEVTSLSWSLSSLDTHSIDTYVTYIMEGFDECNSMCCYCIEHENQKNENRENEMII
ncbi:uncharacterized protein LOC130670920 [Microplitis mediator]|uniref:uncharacterized protein LOC130670920 n=1 Tax=Microplitis mediator TaxID=375433 RepID=UPI002552312D|nr:uncharacterized protein LOC130670920 [Microplitis mediator]